MYKYRPLSILLLIASFTISFASSDVRVRAPQGNTDGSYSYFIKILKLALEDYPDIKIVKTNLTLSQKRVATLLKDNRHIDVGWMGTNREREYDLLAINIPLYKGLLGKRVLAIRKDMKDKFDNIKNQDQLKNLKACQGEHWPDSDILEFNSYNVLRLVKFQSMYKMLKSKRCDYFPRSVMEADSELKALNDNEIILSQKIMLSYPFPMYFFVNKNRKPLYHKIKKGLMKLENSGKLLSVMKESGFGKNVFPLSKYKNYRIFELKNPSLPNLNNKRMWIQLSSP